MKKKLALLMVVSVLLGSTGCLPEKRDVEKGRLTKAQTEEEDDEPTAQATLQKYRGEVVHDLNCYTMYHSTYRRSYGAPQSEPNDYGDIPMHDVNLWPESVEFEDILMSDSRFQKLQDKLDEQFEAIQEEYEDAYEEALDDFVAREKNGSDLTDATWRSKVTVYRADDAVTSIFFDTDSYVNEKANEKNINGNYRTEDASLILFDDVVEDRDALKDYVKKLDLYEYQGYLDELDKEEPIFAITYDGILLSRANLKIPAFGGLEDAFDLSYFSRVPGTYMLYMNEDYTLTWDFDNDGKMEELAFRVDQTDVICRVFMKMGDEEYELTTDLVPSMEWAMNAVPRYVLFSDNMAFVAMFLLEGDDGLEHYIHIPPGEIQEMGDYYPELVETYNPYLVRAHSTERIIGGTEVEWLVTMNGGVPESYGGWCEASTPVMQVQMDLRGKEFDYRTNSVGTDTTLWEGTKVEAVLCNEDTKQIVVKVLEPEEADVRYILLETDGYGGQYVAGVNPYEAFLGLCRYI